MRRLLFAPLIISSALISTGVFAQSAEETQRCVFRCLYNSPGAESEEYNICVRDNCVAGQSSTSTGTGTGTGNRTGGWELNSLSATEPPYLDGRSASVSASADNLTLSYICGRKGDSHLILSGETLSAKKLVDGQQHRVRMTVDHQEAQWLLFDEYEGTLTNQISKKNRLLKEMQRGSKLALDLPGYTNSFSLKGSSKALKGALAYCGR